MSHTELREAVRWTLEGKADEDHAKFSPSSAHRWMVCPGSMALEKDYPNRGSEYADEGTAAHAVLSHCLLNGLDAEACIGVAIAVRQLDAKGGLISEREFTVDDEMAGHVQVVLDAARRRAAGKTILVEQRVGFTQAIGTTTEQSGTADILIIDGSTVEVHDFKYGAGVKVYASERKYIGPVIDPESGKEIPAYEVKGNHQMLSYALGTLETYGELFGPFEKFRLVIHQPRCDGGWEDEYEATLDEVLEHGREMRAAALKCDVALEVRDDAQSHDDVIAAKKRGEAAYLEKIATKIPDDLLNPEDHACKFCRAKPSCPALAKRVMAEAFDEFEDLTAVAELQDAQPKVPSGDRLGYLWGLLPVLSDWCKAIEDEVNRLVSNGMTVIGPDGQPMKLVEGRKGHRKWIDEGMAEGVLVGLLPPDKVYLPREIISPAKAEAILKKKRTAALWDQVKQLYEQAPGKPIVVLGSDPRPAYSPQAQPDEFDDLTEDPTA